MDSISSANRVVATIEARMGSTRLPGKMALELYPGLSALGAVIERLKRLETIQEIVVATTNLPADNRLEEIAGKYGVRCFRGSEENVLGRVVGAGTLASADALVLATGDGSCVSPQVIDAVVRWYLDHEYDLVSNCVFEDSYPVGIDAQVVSFEALERAYGMAQKPLYAQDRNNFEHVNYFIKHHPELFRIYQYQAPEKYHHPEISCVLDTPTDLELMRGIYAKLYPKNPAFDVDDILSLISTDSQMLRAAQQQGVNRLGY